MEQQAPFGSDDTEKLLAYRNSLLEGCSERFRSIYNYIDCSQHVTKTFVYSRKNDALNIGAKELSHIAVLDCLTMDNLYDPPVDKIAENIYCVFNEIYDALLIHKFIAPGSVEDQFIRSVIDYSPAFDGTLDKKQREIVSFSEQPTASQIDITGSTQNSWKIEFTLAWASQISFTKVGDNLKISAPRSDIVLEDIADTALVCGYARILAAINQVQRMAVYARRHNICLTTHNDWIKEEIDMLHRKDVQTFQDGQAILKFSFSCAFVNKLMLKTEQH